MVKETVAVVVSPTELVAAIVKVVAAKAAVGVPVMAQLEALIESVPGKDPALRLPEEIPQELIVPLFAAKEVGETDMAWLI